MQNPEQPIDKPKRRWLRFGIRSLLLLILVISLPMGLIGRDLYCYRVEQDVVLKIEAAGGKVLTSQFGIDPFVNEDDVEIPDYSWRQRLLMKVFGEGFYRRPYSISFDQRDVGPFLQEASKLETVNGLVLDNAQFTADSPEHIAKMQELNYVGLDNVTISPDHFQQFALLPHVAHFRIDCVDLTDAHLEAMGNCRSLKSVTLFDTRLSDEGLRSLNQIPSLKELNITLPRAITERGFDSLAGLPSLEKLFLTHVPIDDQCLVAFSQIKTLQTLHIVGSPEDITISEQGLDHLASLPNLEVLHLDFIPLVDEELASIGRLRQLKDFQCLGTHVTDKGLEHLLQLTHLESLRIQEAQLSMETLRSFARSDSVRTVDLGNGLKCSFPERNSGNYGMPYADNRADYDQNRRGKVTRSVFCLVGEILPPLPNTPSVEDPSTTPTELPNNFADTISDPFLPPSEELASE